MAASASPFNRQRQHRQKRQIILSEAAKLFNRKGTRSTTLAEIAARLELTKTSLYYYVKTKEELVYQCYRQSCDEQQALLRQADSGASGREKIELLTRGYFQTCRDIALKRRAETAILTEIKTLKDSQRKEISRRYQALYSDVRSFIEQGIADASLKACEPSATALLFFFNLQWTATWLRDLSAEEIPVAGESFLNICLYGLATRARPHPRHNAEIGAPAVAAGFDRKAQNQLKQEAFFRVGSRYFNHKGFRGTSLDEIAAALEVTKGAFYYHIQNKERLLYECFRRTLELTRAMQASASRQGRDGLEKLQLCLHDLFCIQTSSEGPLVRYNLATSLDSQRRRKVIELIRNTDRQFRRFVQQGIEDGSIRAINTVVAEQLISGSVNASADWTERLPLKDPNKAAADFYQLLFTGISAERPPAAG